MYVTMNDGLFNILYLTYLYHRMLPLTFTHENFLQHQQSTGKEFVCV